MKIIVIVVFFSSACFAQDQPQQHHHMEGMDMGQPESSAPPEHAASGTSVNPRSSPMDMIHKRWGDWTFMFHGVVFVADEQQTGPRGGDKFFAPNWFMGTASHAAASSFVRC